MRLAIFGGTFDPVHEAHLALARQAADSFRLNRVLFVPAARPPHKAGRHPAPPTKTACACWSWPARAGTASRFPAWKRALSRSYSIDTILKVRARLAPGDELFFIIGADAFAEIVTWLQMAGGVAGRLLHRGEPPRPLLSRAAGDLRRTARFAGAYGFFLPDPSRTGNRRPPQGTPSAGPGLHPAPWPLRPRAGVKGWQGLRPPWLKAPVKCEKLGSSLRS